MFTETAVQELFTPIFAKLVAMVGAGRDGFNRHSRASMDDFQKLQREVLQQVGTAIQQVQGLAAPKGKLGQTEALRLQSFLTRLQIIAETLGGLMDPIQKKIKDGILFSDKAVTQTNFLFDTQAGLLRSLMDIVKTNNDFLKRYTAEESRKLVVACNDFATEHEARLIEGLCLPQAAPLFLAILDRVRTVSQNEVDLANLLAS